jgi:hypothetical protein
MSDTSYTSYVTRILSTWLNAVNKFVYQGLNPNYVTSTGAANNFTVTIPATSLISALVAGTQVTFKAHQANTGAAMLTLVGGSSLAATALQLGGQALGGGEIASGATVTVVYDGTAWQVLSASGAGIGQMLGNIAPRVIFYNAQTIAEDITVGATQNAMSVGPVSVSSGYAVTVTAGVVWKVI